MSRYDFLVETYRTERLKTLGVWLQIPAARLDWRPEARARSPLEHMVHQCMSEDTWMRTMLGITSDRRALRPWRIATRFEHYAACSADRLAALERQNDAWFEEQTQFFDVRRTRAWVLTRRITHTAHHRGQLPPYIRLWGLPLYSTYGPTADTGGLPKHGARVVYRNVSGDDLPREQVDVPGPPLPGPGEQPVTERPRIPPG
ncbi:MAG: damage-inducible protein DinB [Acidobacteria bacterium]|nr:MAG: damage-inducible protein DinB [Acidobacteriota bacterium]